jgi:hypothetical protein
VFILAGELMEACKKIIGSYEKRAAPGETLDAYADVFLPLYNVVHPYDIIFVKQVKMKSPCLILNILNYMM